MDRQKKEMEETLKTVIEGLSEGFRKDARTKHADACARYVSEYGKSLFDPEQYNIFVSHDLQKLEDVLVDQLLSIDEQKRGMDYTREQRHELEFLYTHYDYLESHLNRIFEAYEGSVCSVDKSRYVLGLFQGSIIDGNTPTFEDRRHYWVPNFGEAGLYLDLVKGLHRFHHGRPEDYLSAHAALTARLDQLTTEKATRRHDLYTTHAAYTGHEEQPTRFGGRIKTVYSFAEGDTTLEIHIDDPGNGGFRLLVDGESLGYRERDRYPEWTRCLMNEI